MANWFLKEWLVADVVKALGVSAGRGIQRFERISREHRSQLALFHIGRKRPCIAWTCGPKPEVSS